MKRRMATHQRNAAEDFRSTVRTNNVWRLTRESNIDVRSVIVSIISVCRSTSSFIAIPISFCRFTAAWRASIAWSLSKNVSNWIFVFLFFVTNRRTFSQCRTNSSEFFVRQALSLFSFNSRSKTRINTIFRSENSKKFWPKRKRKRKTKFLRRTAVHFFDRLIDFFFHLIYSVDKISTSICLFGRSRRAKERSK